MNDEPQPAITDPEEQRSGESPLEIARNLLRWRWYFFAPLFTCGLAGFALSHLLPLKYTSNALIIVENQKIPEQYVTPNVLMTLQTRLDTMKQQVLSRTRLRRFIEDYGLYAAERKRKSMDDVIDMMQERISVQLVQTPGRNADLTGFKIIFSDVDRHRAQQVTNELTSLFIELDTRERTEQSQRTTAFLESQLEETRKELATEEERVRHYKLAHLGQLPEQQQSNLQILSSLEAQLQASTAALDRAEQQRIYLESMRTQQEVFKTLPQTREAAATPDAPAPEAFTSLNLAEATLADLWKQLKELSGKLTDMHPQVVAVKWQIAEWETTVQRLKTERMAAAEIESRLKSIRAEIEHEKREGEELRKRIREVQARLSQTPVREQELAELTRQYDNVRSHYQSLLQKKLGSELASNLEERQGGEQFRLLDPANLPKRPEGRSKIVLIGWVLGVALGAGLVMLREWSDQSVHRQADLERHQWVPVLVKIPTVRTVREESRQRLVWKIEALAVAVMVLISLGTGAHVYLRG
jgi:polysaccharide chain length determinant protein (PEP-CTERM system associated)